MDDATATDPCSDREFDGLLSFLADELGGRFVREVSPGPGRVGIRSIEVMRGDPRESFMESWIPLVSDAFGAEVLTHDLTYLMEVPVGVSE